MGLAYLPAQGSQTTGKLYFSWAPHMGEGETDPSHGWSESNLANPQPAGPWRIGKYWNYVTGDYIFPIPAEWAAVNTPGLCWRPGRFRDGGQGAQGPSVIAYGPWTDGNPPASNATLTTVPLLLYGDVYTPDSPTLNNYHHSDGWSGGEWLTAGDKATVIFVGTKGTGTCWYGCPDGTVWPPEPPYPPDCEDRGWWSTGFAGQILFYDPAALAAVAQGESGALGTPALWHARHRSCAIPCAIRSAESPCRCISFDAHAGCSMCSSRWRMGISRWCMSGGWRENQDRGYIYVRFVGTHAEYDQIHATTV